MKTKNTKQINLELLKQIIPFKWRVQSTFDFKGGKKARMIAYVDARAVQEKLDKVVGAENWQDEYYQVKNTLFCKIGILINDNWNWKSGAGVPSKTEKEKGEASDAFKRAGVKWGINRDAYSVETVNLPTKEWNGKFFPCDENGSFLKGDKLNQVCNTKAKIEEMPNYLILEEKEPLKQLA